MGLTTFRLLAFTFLSAFTLNATAQSSGEQVIKLDKPYKLATSGKQVTIRSVKGIRHVMLWTTGGNRVVEQGGINNNSWVMNIPVNDKAFFLMVGLGDGKIYTEKIGIQ